MLWFQPARDWLDGKTPRAVAGTPAVAAAVDVAPAAAHRRQRHPPRRASRGPTRGSARTPVRHRPAGVPGRRRAGRPSGVRRPAGPPVGPRPPALMWACGLAWAGSAVVFVGDAAQRRRGPGRARHAHRRALPPEPGAALGGHHALDVAVDGALRRARSWSSGPSSRRLLAAYAWRGRPWAWTALLVSACCASVLCLLAALSSPALLVPLAVCASDDPAAAAARGAGLRQALDARPVAVVASGHRRVRLDRSHDGSGPIGRPGKAWSSLSSGCAGGSTP